MKKIILALCVLFNTSGLYAQLSLPQGLQPLPLVTRWTDHDHFLMIQPGAANSAPVLVDARTGAKAPYAGSNIYEPRPQTLRVRNNDIYLATQRLTNTPDLEKVNPEFSPDSSHIAYTRKNDLYVFDVKTKQEQRLTKDGTADIMNGYASWVYMEEILGRTTNYRAFWWSPDSKRIAFFRTDDTKVPLFTITDAGADHGIVKTQRYPQPGDANPEVKVGVVDIANGATSWMDIDEHADQYFGTPYWQPDGRKLLVQWLNRKQTDYRLYSVDPVSGNKEEIYSETQKTWINLDEEDRLTFLPGSNSFLFISDKSGYRQLYYHNAIAKSTQAVTNGAFVVKSISYIDTKSKVVYFIANRENPIHDDLYRIGFDGKGLQRLTFGPYTHRVTSSSDGSYFTTRYGNATTPEQLALINNKGKLIKVLADSKTADFDMEKATRKDEVLTVKSEDGLFDLPMRISYPRHMEPGKKYPLMVVIYGGPGSTDVNDYFSPSMFTKEDNGCIYAYLDHRGAYEFGKVGQNYMYHNLGYWEIKDWTQQVKWLIQKRQADPEKVMISGFSYGGYITCYALVNAPDIFKFGSAGGSVTDWRYYDSHYTERYMGSPAENPEGYKTSSVFTNLKNLKGRLLLVHGMADDNVHVMNTLQLAAKLEELNKSFEMMLYPGNTHNMIGPKINHYNAVTTRFREQVLFGK